MTVRPSPLLSPPYLRFCLPRRLSYLLFLSLFPLPFSVAVPFAVHVLPFTRTCFAFAFGSPRHSSCRVCYPKVSACKQQRACCRGPPCACVLTPRSLLVSCVLPEAYTVRSFVRSLVRSFVVSHQRAVPTLSQHHSALPMAHSDAPTPARTTADGHARRRYSHQRRTHAGWAAHDAPRFAPLRRTRSTQRASSCHALCTRPRNHIHSDTVQTRWLSLRSIEARDNLKVYLGPDGQEKKSTAGWVFLAQSPCTLSFASARSV